MAATQTPPQNPPSTTQKRHKNHPTTHRLSTTNHQSTPGSTPGGPPDHRRLFLFRRAHRLGSSHRAACTLLDALVCGASFRRARWQPPRNLPKTHPAPPKNDTKTIQQPTNFPQQITKNLRDRPLEGPRSLGDCFCSGGHIGLDRRIGPHAPCPMR